jgi:hypothetical protein
MYGLVDGNALQAHRLYRDCVDCQTKRHLKEFIFAYAVMPFIKTLLLIFLATHYKKFETMQLEQRWRIMQKDWMLHM